MVGFLCSEFKNTFDKTRSMSIKISSETINKICNNNFNAKMMLGARLISFIFIYTVCITNKSCKKNVNFKTCVSDKIRP